MLERQQPDSSTRTALAQPPDAVGTCSAAFPGSDRQHRQQQQPQPRQPSSGSPRRYHNQSCHRRSYQCLRDGALAGLLGSGRWLDAIYQDAASENVVLGWPLVSCCHPWCLSPCRNNSSSPSWRYVSRCCCMFAAKLLYCFVEAACC